MNEREPSHAAKPDENVACDICGRFGAFAFDGKQLCLDCYESCGSCCPEFGKDEESPSDTA